MQAAYLFDRVNVLVPSNDGRLKEKKLLVLKWWHINHIKVITYNVLFYVALITIIRPIPNFMYLERNTKKKKTKTQIQYLNPPVRTTDQIKYTLVEKGHHNSSSPPKIIKGHHSLRVFLPNPKICTILFSLSLHSLSKVKTSKKFVTPSIRKKRVNELGRYR